MSRFEPALQMSAHEMIRVEDRGRFIQPIQRIHRRDPRWLPYWQEEFRRSCEGIWAEDFGAYRYMPGRGYFYGHYGTIQISEGKERPSATPDFRDIEWDFCYSFAEAEGFSGFVEDQRYTSYRGVKTVTKDYALKYCPDVLRDDGSFKEFVDAREYLRMTHEKPLGRPVFENDTQNYNELGSRGGGKSYRLGQCLMGHMLITDLCRYYVPGKKRNKAQALIGSGDDVKSGEVCNKVVEMFDGLETREELGANGRPGDVDYYPSPMSRTTMGSLATGNKENAFRTQHKIKLRGKWRTVGSGSSITHVNYSINKRTAAEAGAGGRYNLVLYEESGVTEMIEGAWASNEATIQADGIRFGVQACFGTSGNLDTIGPAKRIFLDPQSYKCIGFRNMEPGSGTTGYFLNTIYTNEKFKNAQGCTDVEAAMTHYKAYHEDARTSNNPKALSVAQMNYPFKISHMWQKGESKLLPGEKAQHRVEFLERGGAWRKLAKCITVVPDATLRDGCTWVEKVDIDPINEFPIVYSKQRSNFDGEIIMYDPPAYEYDNDAPDDLYWLLVDPFVSEGMYVGASMGACQVWMNPLYWEKYLRSTPLVATYFGRPGREKFHERLAGLAELYGARRGGRMIFHESDRGEGLESYFKSTGKTYYLMYNPSLTEVQKFEYGWKTGNETNKFSLIEGLNKLLDSEITLAGGAKTDVISSVNDIQFARQVADYSQEGNFDAISAASGLPILVEAQIRKLKLRSENPKSSKSGRSGRKTSFRKALSNV